jgi:RNA polymerase sigma-70 factor (ECF subfamily)
MIEIEMTMKPDMLSHAVDRVFALFKTGEPLSRERFQQLLNPVKDHLYNFIYKALNFHEDADDVYQDTILRAFKYRHSFKMSSDGAFKTWIFTVAHNQVKKYFNSKNRLKINDSLEFPLEQLHHDKESQQQQRLVEDIYEAAAQLAPQQRNVFFLFYDLHFSIKEIISITGLKEGNVKFILNRCREHIKSTLNKGVQHERI